MTQDHPILGRDTQLELLRAFISRDTATASPNLVLYGPTATGKTLTLRTVLGELGVRSTWIACDECVTPKVVWKKIIQGISRDAGLSRNDESWAMGSFQGFVKQLQKLCAGYSKLHYLVLDRADDVMENGEDVFKNFKKLQELTTLNNLCVIFVVTNIPRSLVTTSMPTVCFQNYTSDDLIEILVQESLCQFSSVPDVTPRMFSQFWHSYVKLIVESYSAYTTNIQVMKNILVKIWPKFTEIVERGEMRLHEFHGIYRRNFKLIGSEYAIMNSITDDTDDITAKSGLTSQLPNISKYLLIAGFLASFNDVKHDWTFFAKLKDYHRKKTGNRSWKQVKVDSKLLEPSPFDLERLFAITHALYSIESGNQLHATVDLMTQVANLGSMRLLLKSSNLDYIGGKTKWKINCDYDFIKGIANDLSFPLDNYLAE